MIPDRALFGKASPGRAGNPVILDRTMPEMGGEEAVRAIRDLRNDARVVLSSGYSEQDVVQRFEGDGVSGFIRKRYAMAMLREALGQVFG